MWGRAISITPMSLEDTAMGSTSCLTQDWAATGGNGLISKRGLNL